MAKGSAVGISHRSNPTYLPTYLSTYQPTHLPTLCKNALAFLHDRVWIVRFVKAIRAKFIDHPITEYKCPEWKTVDAACEQTIVIIFRRRTTRHYNLKRHSDLHGPLRGESAI